MTSRSLYLRVSEVPFQLRHDSSIPKTYFTASWCGDSGSDGCGGGSGTDGGVGVMGEVMMGVVMVVMMKSTPYVCSSDEAVPCIFDGLKNLKRLLK